MMNNKTLEEVLLYCSNLSMQGSYKHCLAAGEELENWVNHNVPKSLGEVIDILLNNAKLVFNSDFLGFVGNRLDNIHSDLIAANKGKASSAEFELLCNEYGGKVFDEVKIPSLTPLVKLFYLENKDRIDEVMSKTVLKPLEFMGMNDFVRKYLRKVRGKIVTSRLQLFMLVSLGITYKSNSIEDCLTCFRYLCENKMIFGTPILFNAGKDKPQLSSCFLFSIDDNLDSILSVTKEFGAISKQCGGIGFNVTGVRAEDQLIGCDDQSNGVVSLLKVYNSVLNYTKNRKRSSAYACFIEPWHADIEGWLELKLNTGDDTLRARELFYGLWSNDLFMERVWKKQMWSLFSPDDCPKLLNSYGSEFKKHYEEYEAKGMALKRIPAESLWQKICDTATKTGGPFIMYKDACNRKSNQKNLGVIRGSNLCTEIVQYSDKDEVAVCNIGSLSLSAFVKDNKIDFDGIKECASFMCRMLNNIIDISHYPTDRARISNMKHRPIGIGVQGMADMLLELSIPYSDSRVDEIYAKVFEYIYFGALEESVRLARRDGAYQSFVGSPISRGELSFDLWKVEHAEIERSTSIPPQLLETFKSKFLFDETSSELNWLQLRSDIMQYGVRNSLVTAQMPTASCVTLDTKIRTTSGVQSYADLTRGINFDSKGWYQINEVELETHSGVAKSHRVYYSGKVPTKTITLEDGTSVVASYNHMLYVKDKGWTYVKDLQPGDELD